MKIDNRNCLLDSKKPPDVHMCVLKEDYLQKNPSSDHSISHKARVELSG